MMKIVITKNSFFLVLCAVAVLALNVVRAIGASPPTSSSKTPPQFGFGSVLIVSGGPHPLNNEYAIESNARYLESLTRRAAWRRVLFADGKAKNRTVSAILETKDARAKAVAAWLLDLELPDATTFVAPKLRPLDGASTPASIAARLTGFAARNDTAPQLLYFTGHGSTGNAFLGLPSLENTLYNGWGGDISTRQIAKILQQSPSKAPLVLVAVQCHSGGFANAMFRDGIPENGVWDRDFCGFFASTAQRQSAGCTAQMDERNYHDFTTHFFAALSGQSRDGRAVKGADFDRNGQVSFNEAYAHAQIHDDSIDVPLNTSDAYLRHLYSQNENDTTTPFSQLQRDATPWQNAVLRGLSRRLKLSGENRWSAARNRHRAALRQNEAPDVNWSRLLVDQKATFEAYYRQERALGKRFPRATLRDLPAAVKLLQSQKRDLALLENAYAFALGQGAQHEIEEAQLLRFVRCARSIQLQKRLERDGTSEQKAVFAQLRKNENRGAF